MGQSPLAGVLREFGHLPPQEAPMEGGQSERVVFLGWEIRLQWSLFKGLKWVGEIRNQNSMCFIYNPRHANICWGRHGPHFTMENESSLHSVTWAHMNVLIPLSFLKCPREDLVTAGCWLHHVASQFPPPASSLQKFSWGTCSSTLTAFEVMCQKSVVCHLKALA